MKKISIQQRQSIQNIPTKTTMSTATDTPVTNESKQVTSTNETVPPITLAPGETKTSTATTAIPTPTPVAASSETIIPPPAAPAPAPEIIQPIPTPTPTPAPSIKKEDINLEEEKKEENEKSPKGRYIRFEVLGRGSFKVVYKAFDSETGKTVAWNEVNIKSLPPTEKKRVISEVKILEKVKHERIISFYGSWYNAKDYKVVFITERVTEGSLRAFCEKVSGLRLIVVRRWAEQILDGLKYLHSQEPPIIHRDLKCENVFVKGEDGSIKIGDLGLSTQAMRDKNTPGTVLGTPEFMAPELYTEKYDETVDVYAFGLVLLEMISMETPYSECMNIGQIIQKVTSGAEPDVLRRVKIPELKNFVKYCLEKHLFEGETEQRRPSAKEVYDHPFMTSEEHNDSKDLVWKRGEEMTVIPEAEEETKEDQKNKETATKTSINGTSNANGTAVATTTTTTTTNGVTNTTTTATEQNTQGGTSSGGARKLAEEQANNKAKQLAEEAENAQRAVKESEEKARQLQEAANQAQKVAEQKKRENKERDAFKAEEYSKKNANAPSTNNSGK